MTADYLGNQVSGEADALGAVDTFVAGFLGYETRAGGVVRAASARTGHGLLNLYAAALFMLLESPEGPVRARPFLERAAACELNEREQRTAEFLAAWLAGDLPSAEATGEAIVHDWPRDLAMLKLVQYLAFNRGDAAAMLRLALASLPHAEDVAQMHGMTAFGYEECHLLADAERTARQALEMYAGDPWAQHALAHVMITEGRVDEGARFLEGAAGGWGELNSFMATHNWWHLGLFYLSQGRDEAVLRAYDAHCWAGDQDLFAGPGRRRLAAGAGGAGRHRRRRRAGARWPSGSPRAASMSSSRSWRCSTSTH